MAFHLVRRAWARALTTASALLRSSVTILPIPLCNRTGKVTSTCVTIRAWRVHYDTCSATVNNMAQRLQSPVCQRPSRYERDSAARHHSHSRKKGSSRSARGGPPSFHLKSCCRSQRLRSQPAHWSWTGRRSVPVEGMVGDQKQATTLVEKRCRCSGGR